MNNKVLIIGGSGQLGIHLASYLLKKKYKVYISTRSLNKKSVNKLKEKFSRLKPTILKLDIYRNINISEVLNKIKPNYIFYFAGQSSVSDSFKKNLETMNSNYLGCKNVLDQIIKLNLNLKFFNANSVEIFGNKRKKISINTEKNPVSPYGISKLKSFNLVKKYRRKYNLSLYNGLLSNCESYQRPLNFVLPKTCIAALKAKNDKNLGIITKFNFGNINVARDWGWAEEYMKYVWKKINNTDEFDFIISTGKTYTLKKLIQFAFESVNLNWKNHILTNKKLLRKKEIHKVRTLKVDKFKIIKTDGKAIIIKLLKFYKKEKLYLLKN